MRTLLITGASLFGLVMVLTACGSSDEPATLGEPFLLCTDSPVKVTDTDLRLVFGSRARLIMDDGEIDLLDIEAETDGGTEGLAFESGRQKATIADFEVKVTDMFASSPNDDNADCAEFAVTRSG